MNRILRALAILRYACHGAMGLASHNFQAACELEVRPLPTHGTVIAETLAIS